MIETYRSNQKEHSQSLENAKQLGSFQCAAFSPGQGQAWPRVTAKCQWSSKPGLAVHACHPRSLSSSSRPAGKGERSRAGGMREDDGPRRKLVPQLCSLNPAGPSRTQPDQRGLKASARSRRKNSWYSLTFIKSIDSLAKKSGAGEMAHGLLFQRTQLLLPAPTWQLPVICVVRG